MLFNIRKFKLSKLACYCILANPLWAASVHAEDIDSLFSLSLEELLNVEVETRKTKETLGKVPLSNSLISQQYIANNHIHSIYELAEFVPNFSYRPSFGRLQERGVTRGIANVTGENVTGVFVDGMSVTHLVNTLDLSQFKYVEVIRGPQATLYGRSTFAGAVNLVSQNPLENIDNTVSVSIGDNQQSHVNVKAGYQLSEQVAFQVYGQAKNKDGEYENTLGDGGGVLNTQNNTSVTAIAAYRSNDDTLNAKLTYINNIDDDSGYPVVLQNAGFNNCYLDSPRQYYCGELNVPSEIGFNNSALTSIAKDSGYQSQTDVLLAHARYELTSDHLSSFKLVHTNNDTQYLVDGDYSEVPFSLIGIETTKEATEVELHLNSQWSDKLSTLAGVLWYDSTSTSIIDSYFPVNQVITSSRFRDEENKIENSAIFGSLTYKINESSDVIVDVRWSSEDITFSNPSSDGKQSFDSFTPKITYRLNYTDSMMLYASYSNGSKPGGFNANIWNSTLNNADQSLRDSYRAFEQESLLQTEFGVKGTTSDNQLTYAANIYFGTWSDLQTAQSVTFELAGEDPSSESVISNEGSAKTRGFEVEVKQQHSSALNTWANLGYAYTEFTDSFTSAQEQLTGNGDISGNQIPNSPELTAAFGASYTMELGNWEITNVASLHHESKRYVAEHNLAEIPAINRLRFGINALKGAWKLSLHSSLAEDSSYIESVARLGDPSSFYRLRAFGLSLSDANYTELTLAYRF